MKQNAVGPFRARHSFAEPFPADCRHFGALNAPSAVSGPVSNASGSTRRGRMPV
jgi:hypothetical protein